MTDATATLVFADTEITSLRPDRRVWNIGLVTRRSGEPDDRNELLLCRHDMAQQAVQLADIVMIAGRLIAAMNQHPECATAREAWLADSRRSVVRLRTAP